MQFIPSFGVASFVILALISISKKSGRTSLHPSILTGILYWGCLFIGAAFVNPNELFDGTMWFPKVELSVVVGFTGLLLIAMSPTVFIRKGDLSQIIEHPIVKYMAIALTPFVWYSFIYLAPYAIESVLEGADKVRINIQSEGVLPGTIATTVAVGVAQFYPIFILMFYVAVLKNYSIFLKGTVIVGIILPFVQGMVFTARDSFVFVPVLILMCYWFFEDKIHETGRRIVKRVAAVITIISVILFVFFTWQRFYNKKYDVLKISSNYYGAQLYVFIVKVQNTNRFYNGHLRFPVFRKLIGKNVVKPKRPKFDTMFGTFASDLYTTNGWGFAYSFVIVFAGLYLVLGRLLFKLSALSYIIVTLLYIQFLVTGVFYFRLGCSAGNLYHIIMAPVVFGILFHDITTGTGKHANAYAQRKKTDCL